MLDDFTRVQKRVFWDKDTGFVMKLLYRMRGLKCYCLKGGDILIMVFKSQGRGNNKKKKLHNRNISET